MSDKLKLLKRIERLEKYLLECVECIEEEVRHSDIDHPTILRHQRAAAHARMVLEEVA